MKMPNFLIIGAQKAGTTALAQHITQHPQVFMSSVKEPGFFDFENDPPRFNGPGDQELYSQVVTNLGAYQNLFQAVSDEIAIGEATTWYLYSEKAPKKIHHYLPQAKIVVILRNPIERAYSAFLHAVRDNRETYIDFQIALQKEQERIAHDWEYLWRYTDMGFYSIQLERYYKEFNAEQIKVYLYEDLQYRPSELLTDLCQFLNIDPSLISSSIGRRNVSGKPKNKLLHDFLLQPNPLKRLIRPLVSKDLRSKLRIALNNRNRIKEEMPYSARIYLKRVYKEDILDLQSQINRDLSAWLA